MWHAISADKVLLSAVLFYYISTVFSQGLFMVGNFVSTLEAIDPPYLRWGGSISQVPHLGIDLRICSIFGVIGKSMFSGPFLSASVLTFRTNCLKDMTSLEDDRLKNAFHRFIIPPTIWLCPDHHRYPCLDPNERTTRSYHLDQTIGIWLVI